MAVDAAEHCPPIVRGVVVHAIRVEGDTGARVILQCAVAVGPSRRLLAADYLDCTHIH
jgi:folate-dependent phosphoribosylglycinamide formyltransferase PurN